MVDNKIWTKKALSVIGKRLRNERLSQQDSNYLSRFVRPKLRDIALMDAQSLLRKLEYNPKTKAIEKKIREIILDNVKKVDSIIICGSAIQTNYKEYNDIDVIVAIKGVLAKSLREKRELIGRLEEMGKKEGINLDIQIYPKSSILSQYSRNPGLIYQLKDSKVIYGELSLPRKVSLSNLDLKMKLDWSEGIDSKSDGREIYYAIRNALLVLLLLDKKVDNYQLINNLNNSLGHDMIYKMKSNSLSKEEKALALSYLNLLIKYLETELNKPKWEKIEIENP